MALSVTGVITVFLLSFTEVISQCPPSSGKTLDVYNNNCIKAYIGIYLSYDEKCYPNGSYFWDLTIRPLTPLQCALPGATLNGGQWIGPNGVVPCDGGNNQNVQCTTGSGANLSVHINPNNGFLGPPGDGWYMCCLPTGCSDPNTNIIFANIHSKRRL